MEEPPEDRTERSGLKLLRADLVIATLALLASVMGSIAVIFQTHTIANQLSASVWPYLTYEYTMTPQSIGVHVVNQGLGPALVRTFVVTIDGRPATRVRDFVDLFEPKGAKRHISVDSTDLGGGTVIRPGETFTVLDLSDPKLNHAAAAGALTHATATICYCSLLGNCWTLQGNETEPHEVGACGTPTAPITY